GPAAVPARPLGRLGQVGHRHRAPPGGHGPRRLDHRPRSRRRPRWRPRRVRGHAGGAGGGPLDADGPAPRRVRRRRLTAAARGSCRGASVSPRTPAQRRRDTEQRLATDVDVWVASASPDGTPHLVPLSFDWDGEAVLLATPTHSRTGRNLAASRTVRLALGHTRDVVTIDGTVEVAEMDDLPRDAGDRFAARAGFDPR